MTRNTRFDSIEENPRRMDGLTCIVDILAQLAQNPNTFNIKRNKQIRNYVVQK